MSIFKTTPVDSLLPPAETFAALFPVDIPTKSVLLFSTFAERKMRLGGYLFRDPGASKTIKEAALADFSSQTKITVTETNPSCLEIVQKLIGEESDRLPAWKFMIILKNFRIPPGTDGLPENFHWFHRNVIPWGRIHCEAEREFLRTFMSAL